MLDLPKFETALLDSSKGESFKFQLTDGSSLRYIGSTIIQNYKTNKGVIE